MTSAPRLATLTAVAALFALLLAVSSIESLTPASRGSHRTGRQRQTGEEQQQSCHMRELDLCLSSLMVFFQSNHHPITNSEISRQCKIISEMETCVTNYTSRCMTESQAQMVEMFGEGGYDIIRDLCKPGTKMHSNYLKHGDCINAQHKGQRNCMRDLQVSLEKAADIVWQDRLKLACCTYNKFHACMREVIEPKCGTEAYEMQRQWFRAALSRLPSVTCNKYEHHSKLCTSLLPPAGSQPKGAKSHSVLSKLFSTYTGQ